MKLKSKIIIGIIILLIIIVLIAIGCVFFYKGTFSNKSNNVSISKLLKENENLFNTTTNSIKSIIKDSENKITAQLIQENVEEVDEVDNNYLENNSKNNTDIKTNNKDSGNKKTTTSKENTNKPQESNSSNTENQQKPVEEPEQQEPELAYWCIEGGTHHIAGDGANEHGYYSSWDSAYQAFEEYTKNWASCQYKIDQCACGKYYFWAIK